MNPNSVWRLFAGRSMTQRGPLHARRTWLIAFAAIATTLTLLPGSPARSATPTPSAPGVVNKDLKQLADHVADSAGVTPVRGCESLATENLTVDKTAPASVGSAKEVAAADGVPAYCQVTGYIAPAIRFEVRLPVDTWNGRYFQTGCGGFCGNVPTAGCLPAQQLNFATAAQNMGHDLTALGPSALWARDRGLRADFAYRSTHVTSIVAKHLIRLYYGQPAKRSYFGGCSTGGREGQMEASRYPDDFDGIVAGDPAYPQRLGAIFNNWVARYTLKDDGSLVFTKAKADALHTFVLDKCDANDGLKDGLIEDPRNCHVNFTELACKDGSDPAICLTKNELFRLSKIYDFPRNSRGTIIYPGHMELGSELQLADTPWLQFQATLSNEWLRHAAFPKDPPGSYSYRQLNYDRDTSQLKKLLPMYDPQPDLRKFRSHGGKMLVYHGWADVGVAPLEQVDYRAEVRKHLGSRTDDTLRLFLIPGMEHCRGGSYPVEGMSLISQGLLRVVRWVEDGDAPNRMVVGYGEQGTTAGVPVVRTRPVFPYPRVARYDGTGSTDKAKNFVAAKPPVDHSKRDDIVWHW